MKKVQAHRLDTISEYIFAKLAKDVKEVEKKTGKKVLSFGAGTPDVPPSDKYVHQLLKYVQASDAHLYPGYGAIPELSQALRNWYNRRFGVTIDDRQLLPLLGAKDGISHLPLAMLDAGDEVLVPDPGYPAFTDPARLVGAKIVTYDLPESQSFRLDVDILRKKITPKTKIIWLNFPSNPTGQVATLSELTQVIHLARERGVYIVYDNTYSEIAFGDHILPSILQVEGAEDVAVEIGSFSKMCSFAGWRIGWIVGNRDIIAAMAKVKSQMDSGLSLPLQHLAAYALSHPDREWEQKMIKSYRERRDVIAAHLSTLGLTFTLPSASLYIWAKIPDDAANSVEYSRRLLHERQILLTPGSAFGHNGERYVRVSICVNIDTINDYF